MIVSLKITSKIPLLIFRKNLPRFQVTLFRFVLMVATLKIQVTFSSSVLISSLKEINFSVKLLILIAIF